MFNTFGIISFSGECYTMLQTEITVEQREVVRKMNLSKGREIGHMKINGK